jgi:hypothetical protein
MSRQPSRGSLDGNDWNTGMNFENREPNKTKCACLAQNITSQIEQSLISCTKKQQQYYSKGEHHKVKLYCILVWRKHAKRGQQGRKQAPQVTVGRIRYIGTSYRKYASKFQFIRSLHTSNWLLPIQLTSIHINTWIRPPRKQQYNSNAWNRKKAHIHLENQHRRITHGNRRKHSLS